MAVDAHYYSDNIGNGELWPYGQMGETLDSMECAPAFKTALICVCGHELWII